MEAHIHESRLLRDMEAHIHESRLLRDMEAHIHESRLLRDMEAHIHESRLLRDMEAHIHESRLLRDMEAHIHESRLLGALESKAMYDNKKTDNIESDKDEDRRNTDAAVNGTEKNDDFLRDVHQNGEIKDEDFWSYCQYRVG